MTSWKARLASGMCRAYQVLLFAYPPGFRRRYGKEMALAFRDRVRDALDGVRPLTVLETVGRIGRDFLQTVVREWGDVEVVPPVHLSRSDICLISIFQPDHVVRRANPDRLSQELWGALALLGAVLLIVGWLRWMAPMSP